MSRTLASLLEVDTRDSVLGRQLCDFMEAADRARAAEQLQAFSSGRTGELPFERFQIRGAQGRESIVEVGGVPMQYEGERALAVLVYDVTASERSRAAIEAERAKLRI